MNPLRAWLIRLAGLVPNERRERELADELEAHLQMHIDDNVRAGMTHDEARRHALVKLGGVESTKEAYRDRSRIPMLQNLLQDSRFSLRQLRKSPGFTLTAIAMLSLGICASVSIFAFVDAALIKPLPYKDPTRLVAVFESIPMAARSNLSYADYIDWKKLNTVFSSLDAYQRGGALMATPDGAKPARTARVSDGFFRTLGVSPVLGRDFFAGEDSPSAPRTIIVSHSTWQTQFARDPNILGQTVTLDGDTHTIVGVLPREFHFSPAEPAAFWLPMKATSPCELRRSCHTIYGVARLKDDVSIETALADVTRIAKLLEKQYPESNRDQGAALAPLTEVISGDIKPLLIALLGGAMLLLLIAAVNVANLLLVRSEGRRREIAVRSALGASTGRLLGQFLTESLMLVTSGTALGLLGAHWVMKLLAALIPEDMLQRMSFLRGLGLNERVIAFAGVISLFALLLFSVTPSLRLIWSGLREGLAEGGRGSAGTAWRRVGSKLVVVELATAVVLLAGAGLLGKSLYHLLHVEVGFEPDKLATLEVVAPGAKYKDDKQRIALQQQLVQRIGSLPGVQRVGLANQLPTVGEGSTTWFRVVGRPHNGGHYETPQREVSAGYFETLGAKLLRGRDFYDSEDQSKPPVAIVNQALAKKYFPGEEALGKHLTYLSATPRPMEIVGIVDDIKESALDATTPPVLYVPCNQSPNGYFSLLVRTSQSEESILTTIAATIREIDADLVTLGPTTVRTMMNNSQPAYIRRSSAWLLGAFAAAAFILSVVGLYGVIAYSVSQRGREIGVRMALGAEPGNVYRLVLREAGWLTAGGIVVGLACAIAAATYIRGLLFQVQSWDLPTLAIVATVLGIAALLASYVPARRAAGVNPVDALRAE